MSRWIGVAVLLGALLVPEVSKGEVYFAFSAEQLEYQGVQRVFFVPFSFTGPGLKQTERKIGVLFEKLHGSRAAVYGDTYLVVKETGGQYVAHLILDPKAERFHDIITGEIYLTLATIGITQVFLDDGERLLSDADVKFPYFVPTVPLWEALPPSTFPHALVRLGENEYVESRTFYDALAKKDSKLYGRISALFQSQDKYVKIQVLKSVPNLQLTGEVDLLLPLLQDADAGVRYKTIELLESRVNPKVLSTLATLADTATDPETQLRAAKILVKNGNNHYQIYILFEDLKSEDASVVIQTIQKLASSGDKRVLPALVGMLLHAQATVRDAAFDGLKQLRDLDNLKSLLSNASIEEKYRKDVAVELMKQGVPEFSQEGIKYLLANHTGAEAVEAITTIEMRTYRNLADQLTTALIHQDEQVALAAVAAIGNLGLIDRLGDLSAAAARPVLTAKVRETISKMLAKLSLKEVMKLAVSQDILTRELSVLALVEQARSKQGKEMEPVLDLLGEAMKDKEPVIKRAAVQALFDLGGVRNWKRLLKVAQDADPQVRVLVVKSARSLEDAEGDTAIEQFLADENDTVRIAATVAARERKVKAARQKLKFLVESRNVEQKVEAMRTLVSLNESEDEHKEFFETYKKAIFDMNPDIQLAAIQGIQWIIDPSVGPLLQSGILLMHKDARIRAATLLALGRSRDYNVIEFIARGFADSDKEVQKAAIEGLRLMGHKKAITPLQEYIKQTDDEELKVLATAALQEIEAGPKGLLD